MVHLDAETRSRILTAAWDSFGTLGYARTSLSDVAQRALVTKGAVYHYFGSKRELFEAVHAAVMESTSERAAAGAGGDGDPLQLIQAGVAAFLDAVLEPVTQRILAIDGPAVLGERWESSEAAREGMADFRAYLENAASLGELPPVDAEAMAYVIRGACLRAASAIATSEDHQKARDEFGVAIAALIDGLGRRPSVHQRSAMSADE